jgi:hypothetical protein
MLAGYSTLSLALISTFRTFKFVACCNKLMKISLSILILLNYTYIHYLAASSTDTDMQQ